jgi:hypothetical protein
MTARYLKSTDIDLSAKWITVGNLRELLSLFPDDCGIEAGDLSHFLISKDDDYIGYIDPLNGDGKYVTFKELMDSLSTKENGNG